MTLSKERQKLNCLVATGDKGFQNGLQGNASFLRTDFPALEINPTFVEAVQHPNAWNGVLHSLRLEECLPRLARHSFHPHRTIKELAKSGGNFIRCNTTWSFEFNHATTTPSFLKQPGCDLPDVRCGHHWHRPVERLQETRNHARPARRSYIPTRVLHEPGRTQECYGHRQFADGPLNDRVLGKQIRLLCLCSDR